MQLLKFSLKTALIFVVLFASLFTAWSSDMRRREAEAIAAKLRASQEATVASLVDERLGPLERHIATLNEVIDKHGLSREVRRQGMVDEIEYRKKMGLEPLQY